MSIDVTLSNSLTDLAARIRAEHEGARAAVTRGVEHAIRAGMLLVEAKDQLKHGEWGRWLTEHCAMSGRTARVYMRVARERAAIEAQNGSAADLSLRDAIALIAPAVERPDPAVDLDAWAEVQIEEPFTDWDFEEADFGLLDMKIARCADLPHSVAFAVDTMHEYGLPIMAICSYEEIVEAFRLIMPYAKQQAGFELDVSNPLAAAIAIKFHAMRIVGFLHAEIELREKRSDDRLEKRARNVWQELSAAIDAKAAKLEEIHTRFRPGMDWDDPVVVELRQLAALDATAEAPPPGEPEAPS